MFNNDDETKRIDIQHDLINHDATIVSYIKNNIAIPFQDGSSVVNPRVELVNKERWSDVIDRGGRKDQTKELVNLPVIVLYRSNIEIIEGRIPKALGEKFYTYVMARMNKGSYNPETNRKEFLITAKPIDIQVMYDVRVVTNMKKHNDIITQRFIVDEGKNWSDSGYFMIPKYNNMSDSSQNAEDAQERIIRTSFSMMVDSKLKPSLDKNGQPPVKKVGSFRGFEINTEAVMNGSDFDKFLTDNNFVEKKY
jgi:hypothetical protein